MLCSIAEPDNDPSGPDLNRKMLSQAPAKRRNRQTTQARRVKLDLDIFLQTFITSLPFISLTANSDMSSIRESHIEQALRDLQNSTFTSIRAAAKVYDLSESTLRHRYRGKTVSHSIARTTTRSLSSRQEKLLIS